MNSKIGFLYIGDKYKDEEKYISKYFTTIRLTTSLSEIANIDKLIKCDYVLLRGSKFTQEEYEKIYAILKQNKINAYSSPVSYKIANSAILYSKLLGENAPNLYVFSARQSDEEIIESFKNNLVFPLFVRSDKESAAKYVGVDGCIVSSENKESFKIALDNLRNNVKNINDIIFKQVIPIKQYNKKINLEYRAIVFNGKLICFDYNKELPNPSDYGLDESVTELALNLMEKGFDGGYFMDFAIKENGGFYVVECKDLINGTIKNIDRFIKLLQDKI